MSIWLRSLTSSELLALVRYGAHLFSELEPMRAAGLISAIALDGRWSELRSDDDQVAPGIHGGVRLGDGVWVVLASEMKRPFESPNHPELERLYADVAQNDRHLLVYGVGDELLPIRVVDTPRQQVLRDEVTRLRRHLTVAQEHTLREALHHASSGLHSEDAGERWRAFIDLGDLLVDDQRRVHPAVFEELKGLFIPLLSGTPSRHQAALLLGLISEAMGQDGAARLDDIAEKIQRNLRIVGGHWSAGDWPGVLDEAKPSARICLALVGARVGFGGEDVLEMLVPEARVAVTRAQQGSEFGYRAGMELAIRLAQSGS